MTYYIAVILQIAPVSENLHFAVHPIALCKKIPWHLSTHTVHTYERKQCRCSFACAGVDHNYYFSPLLVQFSQYWSAAPVISIAGKANHGAAQFRTILHNFPQFCTRVVQLLFLHLHIFEKFLAIILMAPRNKYFWKHATMVSQSVAKNIDQ